MPDISMCMNQECPRRSNCYRYRAIPSKLQSYSKFRLINNECVNYMPLIVGDQVREMADIEKV